MPGVPPDAFDQVKKALRGIFRRTKKPKDSRPVSQHQQRPSTQLSSRYNAPQTPQTPQRAVTEPSPARESSFRPSPVQDTPISEPPPLVETPATPRSRPTTANAPRELPSSPRSPIKPTAEQSEASTTEPQSGLEGSMDNKDTAIQAQDVTLEEDDHERSLQAHDGAMIEAEKMEPIHGESLPTFEESHEQEAQLTCSPQKQGNMVESKKHKVPDQSIEEATPADSHHEEPLVEQPEPQENGSEATASLPEITNTDNKSERGRATSDLSEPDATAQDEIHHANEAARRAPPQFHDEKIPVMAEPPQVRPISVAPGMVATSGPLEDFPFR